MDRLFVGTFHKTGTSLMLNLCRDLARARGLVLYRRARAPALEHGAWDICFDHESRFDDLPARHPHRGVLCLRDPRDVVVSAMHYHLRADEKFLHRPDPRFGGRTYQQALLAEPDTEGRLLFELRHRSAETIRHMLRATAAYPGFHRTRLEWLVTTDAPAEWQRVFTALGFPAADLPALLQLAARRSLANPAAVVRQGHARGGSGGEWRAAFTPAVSAAFASAFGDAPARLGYGLDAPQRPASA